MKKTVTTATEKFSEQVGDNIKIDFVKVTTASNVTISGKVTKDEKECGTIAYNKVDNYLICNLKMEDYLTSEEVKAIYAAVPDCITEILA